uniref:Cholinephosphotransferase 1 n=1 Tax=Chrysemys picta bellii TaxID=8478 RepID=A0A8C3F147_CHRPI
CGRRLRSGLCPSLPRLSPPPPCAERPGGEPREQPGPGAERAPARSCHGRAVGAAQAPERGAAEAAGAASLQRVRALAAGAAAAALLGLAGGADPGLAGPQHHHPERPPAQPAHHAAAHRLLPQRHRAGLFVYQSLDAIDGKQARRTNSSSPLGELFDHGCDCISTVFVSIGACIAVRLGTNPDWLFFCCFVGTFMFYCAHWQTYVSGMLKFGKVDVTEVQIAIIILFLMSAFGGTTMWDYKFS